MSGLLHAPAILFILFVMPLWLILHYRYKSRTSVGLSETEHENIDRILEQMDKLSDRIDTLENILNEGKKDWDKENTKNQSGGRYER